MVRLSLICLFLCALSPLTDTSAQTSSPPAPASPIQKLAPVVVTESPSSADRYQLPQVTESITAMRVAETINVQDTEDAVKYLPSIFLRKRNNGDTQAVMATRTWGVSSSARSLIYADGVLLSALFANNNSIGGPRWGLVAPAEIERVDMMYGPFAAAYPGNSMGAVMEITTRLPEKRESSLSQSVSWQDFALYATHHTYRTTQTTITNGGRAGKFAWWLSANYQDGQSQPLGFVTSASFPAGTTGGFAATNKLGQPANVVGASGLLQTQMLNVKLKGAYDFAAGWRGTYSFGLWHNGADSTVETYLRTPSGDPTFAGLAGFASGFSRTDQQHTAQSLNLRSDPKRGLNVELAATLYRMDRDRVRTPNTASANATAFSSAGRAAELNGTGWWNIDLKAGWQPSNKAASDTAHTLTFGVHADATRLANPTYNVSDWKAGGPITSVATEGDGRTRTNALWVQEVWRPTSDLKLTLGARYEEWNAYDGLNVNGATRVQQPGTEARRFSPKASLAWTPQPKWLFTASVGKAYRFATVAELYQLVSTGTTFTSPNPNLRPDDVLAAELKVERKFDAGRARLSLFQDDVRDAMIAQFNPLVPGSSTLFSYISNIDHIRAQGAELVLERSNAVVRGLDLQASVTWLDARTLAMSGRASATAAPGAAIGKRLPNIPEWRGAFVATFRPTPRWAVTAAGRYSSMLFTTLDDADVNPNTYQGFAAWFVTDLRVQYRADHWSAALGADNALNRKYFLFHPFPQRMFVAEVKLGF